MNGFNPDTEKHPCTKCIYGGVWTEQGKPAGNTCKHPEIIKGPGLRYGLYFTCKRPHKKCPNIGVPIGDEMLVHVSFKEVYNFAPRIPEQRAPGENETISRISFSTDIQRAVTAMPNGGEALAGLLRLNEILKDKRPITPILHLYFCATWENKDIAFVPPKVLKEKYNVRDAHWMNEWWALQTPKMSHVIAKVYDAIFQPHIDPAGKKGVLVQGISYDVMDKIPANTAENIFKGFKSTEDIRQLLTVVYEDF